MVGRIPAQGRRGFYFHGADSDDLKSDIATVLQSLPGYEAEPGCQFDAAWTQYFDLLYPSASERQRMANRQILEELKQQGDVHENPRPVRHWIYFRNEVGRANFVARAQQLAYAVKLSEHPASERPFGVCLEHATAVDRGSAQALCCHKR